MTDNRPPTVVVQPSQGVVAVAADTIGALRGTPILLVMVLLNVAFIGAGAYYFRIQQDNIYKLVDKMLDRCLASEKHAELYPPPAPPSRPYSATPDHAVPKETL